MAPLTFGVMYDFASTVITQAMTVGAPANGGQLSVSEGSVFSTKGYALIGNELIHYDSVSGNVLSLNAVDGRGAGGTTVASHIISSVIRADIRVAAHINELVAGSPNTVLTAKGGILTASAAGTPAMLAVGTDGQNVVADASRATGLRFINGLNVSGQVPIADTVVSTPVATIDFQGIPSTYKHLMLVISAINANVVSFAYPVDCRVNNDSAANYDSMDVTLFSPPLVTAEFMGGTGGLCLGQISDLGASPATYTNGATAYIFDYASTTKIKACLSKGMYHWHPSNPDDRSYQMWYSHWKSVAAINRLTLGFFGDGSNFAAGSRATLYGLV